MFFNFGSVESVPANKRSLARLTELPFDGKKLTRNWQATECPSIQR
jgi:hypothetical protein